MKKWISIFFALQIFISSNINGEGISVDAGLTPALDRWIFRTQMRYWQRVNQSSSMNQKMNMMMFPAVLAYGAKSNLTIMVRQIFVERQMIMNQTKIRDFGIGDLYIMGKYKLYRRNTPSYTFGLSTIIGLECPTGESTFTSDTWDLNSGIFASYRRGALAMDINLAYVWNGMLKKGKNIINPGNEFSLDYAVAYQISLSNNAKTALAPVLEFSYKNSDSNQLEGTEISNTGESVFLIAPGLKLTMSSVIFEVLYWLPVRQNQTGIQFERKAGLLVGTRVMF